MFSNDFGNALGTHGTSSRFPMGHDDSTQWITLPLIPKVTWRENLENGSNSAKNIAAACPDKTQHNVNINENQVIIAMKALLASNKNNTRTPISASCSLQALEISVFFLFSLSLSLSCALGLSLSCSLASLSLSLSFGLSLFLYIYIYIYATGLICGPPKRVSRVNLRPPMG